MHPQNKNKGADRSINLPYHNLISWSGNCLVLSLLAGLRDPKMFQKVLERLDIKSPPVLCSAEAPNCQNTHIALLDLSGFIFLPRTETPTVPAKTCLQPAHATLHSFLRLPIGLHGLQDTRNSVQHNRDSHCF